MQDGEAEELEKVPINSKLLNLPKSQSGVEAQGFKQDGQISNFG